MLKQGMEEKVNDILLKQGMEEKVNDIMLKQCMKDKVNDIMKKRDNHISEKNHELRDFFLWK